MDYNKLAELLFPHITKTPEEYEKSDIKASVAVKNL